MSLSPWMYVTLLGLVCIVYAQLLPKQAKPAAGPSGDMMKELEQSMEMFATDMEEQNQTLLQLFSETKRDYEGHLAKLSGRLEQLEKQNTQLVKELTKARPVPEAPEQPAADPLSEIEPTKPHKASPIPAPIEPSVLSGEALKLQQAVAASRQAAAAAAEDDASRAPLLLNVKERYTELFRLHEQNKSVEHIAKKLNMNKGEVHLILQLAKQEEKAHV